MMMLTFITFTQVHSRDMTVFVCVNVCVCRNRCQFYLRLDAFWQKKNISVKHKKHWFFLKAFYWMYKCHFLEFISHLFSTHTWFFFYLHSSTVISLSHQRETSLTYFLFFTIKANLRFFHIYYLCFQMSENSGKCSLQLSRVWGDVLKCLVLSEQHFKT